MSIENKIIIDLYCGAYGLTLIIIINEIDELFFFKALINKLYEGNTKEISMSEYREFKITGISDIVLTAYQGKHPEIIAVNDKIHLLGTKDTWEDWGYLIDSLIEDGSGGHQYLEGYFYSKNSITIELSYKENLNP